MSKISVIVPVFNTEPEYIRVALESLFNQTLSDIEIIVVNDGSYNTDTVSYLQELESDKRLKILHQQNMGLSNARNNGIRIATGEYIGFLDSDDWIDTEFYNKLYTKCKKTNSDIGCGILRIVESNNTQNLDIHGNYKTSKISKKLSYITNGSVCSKIFKRELFNDILFPSGLYYEDNVTLLELFLKSKNTIFDNSVFYNYRSNPTSIVHDKNKENKRIQDSIIILKKINKIARQQPVHDRKKIQEKFLNILFMPKQYETNSEYRDTMNKIFNSRYLKTFNTIKQNNKILTKIRRFIFRIQNGHIKLFKITIHKLKS